MDKDIKKEFNNLARMVKKGFDDVDKKFNEADKRFDILEQGQEDIKSRIDNMAPQFEVNDLKKRVDKLELKHA